MIPSYLRDTGERLSLVAEALAPVVSEFLQSPAVPLLPTIRREAESVFTPDNGPSFDCHRLAEKNTVRITIPAETVDVLCPIIFGGNVTEQALRTAAGQGLASKVAETLLVEGLQAFEFPTLETPPEDALSEQPLLCIDYRFNIEGKGELTVTAAFTRELTDQISAPPDVIPDAVVSAAQFKAEAVGAEQIVQINDMDEWEPGTIVPLKTGSTSFIRLFAVGKSTRTPFAVGELGVENGVKCLRLTSVAAPDDEEALASMAGMAGGAATGGGIASSEFDAPAFDDAEFEAPEFEAPEFEAPAFEPPEGDGNEEFSAETDQPEFEAPEFEAPEFDPDAIGDLDTTDDEKAAAG